MTSCTDQMRIEIPEVKGDTELVLRVPWRGGGISGEPGLETHVEPLLVPSGAFS